MAKQRRLNLTIVVLLAAVAGCSRSSDDPKPVMSTVETIRTGFASATDGSSSGSATVAEPTGYATLRGTFKYAGDLPTPAPLQITKDATVCAPGGKSVVDQNLVVDSATNGIANVLIYVDKVPEEWVHEGAKGDTSEVVFDQKECIFLTRMVAIQTSQSLRVLNSDPVGHNLMVAGFNQTIPSGGESIYQPLKQLRTPEKMACAVHPWMTAWFINRDNGYFAVTAEDGSFEIPNLPAGVELDFRVWQEKSGPISQVTLDGQPAKWSKGKMSITLEPNEVRELDVIVDASVFNK